MLHSFGDDDGDEWIGLKVHCCNAEGGDKQGERETTPFSGRESSPVRQSWVLDDTLKVLSEEYLNT